MRYYNKPLDHYINLYNRKRLELWKREEFIIEEQYSPFAPEDYKHTVQTTLNLSFSAIASALKGLLATQLLQFCSMLLIEQFHNTIDIENIHI